MKRLLKYLRSLWFAPVALVLLMAATRVEAASRAETNAWNDLLRLASEDAKSPIAWGVVTNKCEDFLKRFSGSEHAPDVFAIEARALFNQGKYDLVIEKFSTPPPNMTNAADQFAYWTARAWFEKKNYKSAAETYARLSRDFPSSPLHLEAIYREGETHAKLQEWPRVIEELGETNGVFQKTANASPGDVWVVSGLLLLSEAELARTNYDGASRTLSGIAPQASRPELEWERQFLICRALLGKGLPQEALVASTNLLSAAAGQPDWKAKSIILKGEILESLGQAGDAIQTYEINLNGELPADRRRQALLRIVELTLGQNKIEDAAQNLTNYLAKYPSERESDFEWLLLGELRMKQGTNLVQAEENFTRIKALTNSEYLGKAELNLGWCYSIEGKTNAAKIIESLAAFSNAVERLPFSRDQAVARFKLADTYFALTNFPAAISNYDLLIQQYSSMPDVKDALFEQALYQIVRAGLAASNLAEANNAMNRILEWFPRGSYGDRSMLLVGQEQAPSEARKVFDDFSARYPQSPYLPEIKLAMARTYERENNWPAALGLYNNWVTVYSNNPALPRAEFSRAWSTYQIGNESNALLLFTNFISNFQSNELALNLELPARAQYWIGDYYWGRSEYVKAEISYEEIVHKWPNSSLALPAMMMAGKAALAGQRPEKATNYFRILTAESNCPTGLRSQAAFAWGDAATQLSAAAESNKYSTAIQVFLYIANEFTNMPIAARAWGRLGDCYYALAGDDAVQAATNAISRQAAQEKYQKAREYFERAMDSERADAATRGMAELRLGQTLEAMAGLSRTAEREELLGQALAHFVSVLYGDYLKEDEQADMTCVKIAGLEAAKLAGDLNDWKQAKQFYQRLLEMQPSLQGIIEKKIAAIPTADNSSPDKK